MKASQLIFPIVGFGALTLAASLAGEPPSQPVGQPSLGKKATGEHSADLGLNPAASVGKGAAKSALTANLTESRRVAPGKLPLGSATTAALPGVFRSRIAGIVTLGAPASGGAKNSLSGLNGNNVNMKRKF